MARRPRVHFGGAFYHVMARGNARGPIFLTSEDYQHYLAILDDCRNKFQFTLYAYVLMTNHVHLLIEGRDRGQACNMAPDCTIGVGI